jgi:hypothetical protein
MRRKYLLGVIAVLVLLLAVWLVPMALAAAGGSSGQATPDQTPPGQSQAPSGTQCPFLQAHPWMDPHGQGAGESGSSGTGGTSQQIVYY